MTIRGIDHVAVLVSDLEASIQNWSENFGLSLDHRRDHAGIGIKQAYMRFPDGTFLELVAPLNETSPMASSLVESGEGFRGVSLKVNDVEQTLAQLQSRKVRTFVQGNVTFIHPKSSNGLVISLVENR